MISASHNPYDDNGIKLFRPDGYKLCDAVEAEIEALMQQDLTRAAVARARDRPGASRRGGADALHRIRQAHAAQEHRSRRAARGDRLRQWRGLQGGAGGAVGTGRRSVHHRRRAGRLQHQRQGRLDRAGGAARQGQGSAGRYRHRARWRCRPGDHRRRARRGRRRRPADGGDRPVLAARAATCRAAGSSRR